ncbi:23S rRNA (pseudouridine(1915)-N(3))-methyltransferase RlmH [Helicobacter sp. MIT 14-3879]|uniref:23S rRNA (pseudouridine(1915)-N(3))-methyltransferase RlmH n=1 Tax=Helicobacter sp. MIT 14-3879 TaxID=2040649 RepID=UPI000E1F9779|nr:23S rRNA (pseudouridine(1915)-N(3))-methyltransferase RlmH [Helicobacter sp. MIT 14-3879]RDU64088.1 23S rRNA (pseudouridine(1915)-N(3))-methyltransferase RlmH [Helicobacter sp. MIT 14-3879]
MRIRIYQITKKTTKFDEYIKLVSQFGVRLEVIDVFSANIQKAQKTSPLQAKISYGNELSKYISKDSLNIALHPSGNEVDSYEFSNIIKDKSSINFFIGGAFGFEENFLSKTKNISLSKLTFSHNIVTLILCEQIFRILSIINNHPYHKE